MIRGMPFFTFSTRDLQQLVTELDGWKASLDYRGPLPRAWAGRLRRDLEAESVAASTSMEGVPVTVEEVRRILAGDLPKETAVQDVALVRGYRDAMSFVLRRADDSSFHWDRELIIGLQDRVLAGNWGSGAGRFRSGSAFVVNDLTGDLVFTPPDGGAVPGLVDEARDRVESSTDHPGVTAAWIHVAMAAIHPFKDGNGRSSRVLASLAMYRGGFKLPEFTSLEEWWGRHLQDYYDAFTCLGPVFDAGADVTPFLRAHLEAQLHQVRALDLRERVERRIWSVLEDAVGAADLEPRVVNAAWDAFFGREVTPRYYRPLADVSPATATNDLAAAVAAGLLRPTGKGRSRAYVAGERLNGLIANALDIDIGEAAEHGRQAIVAELTRRVIASGEGAGIKDVGR
jgi:Fic family protein